MPTRRQRVASAVFFLGTAALLGGCNKFKAKQELRKGHEFAKAGQYQTALASYKEALRLDPKEKKIHKSLGYAYMGMYQPGSKHATDIEFATKATEHLKIYVEAQPEDRKAREALLGMYLATEKWDDAIIFYQDFLKENPKDTKAMGSLASIYYKKGDFDQSIQWIEKRLEVEPRETHPEVYHTIGAQAWDRSYNYPDLDPVARARIVDQGLEALNKALEIRPDYFDALSYINLLYREKAKIDPDPVKAQEYLATADRYRQQAMDLRKKQQEAAKSATPSPEPES